MAPFHEHLKDRDVEHVDTRSSGSAAWVGLNNGGSGHGGIINSGGSGHGGIHVVLVASGGKYFVDNIGREGQLWCVCVVGWRVGLIVVYVHVCLHACVYV